MKRLPQISIASLLAGTGFYALSFLFLDQPIAFALQNVDHELLLTISEIVTLLGDGKMSLGFMIVSFACATTLLLKNPQNRFANHMLIFGIAMAVAIFAESSLKYLLGRYRPELLFKNGLYGFHYLSHQFLMTSSPSGHATRIFVIVTAFSLIWKRMTPLFITLGVAVCLSRLFLGYHFLSDVFFGALLGTLITLWTARIYRSLTISDASLAMLY